MKLRKVGRLAATFALAAGLTLGAAACNDKPVDESKQPSTTQVDPKAAVTGGFEKLQNQTYSMEMSVGDIMTASFDVDMSKTATSGVMTMDLAAADPSAAEMGMGTMEIEMISIGTDVWMKINGGLGELMPDGWLHTTADSADMAEMGQFDVTEMTAKMMDSLQDVKEVGPNTFTGTIDPNALDGAFGEDVGGPEATPMQLTVTLTDDGLIQSIEADIEGVKDGETVPMKVTFSGYGEPVTIEAPPADQVTELDDLGAGF